MCFVYPKNVGGFSPHTAAVVVFVVEKNREFLYDFRRDFLIVCGLRWDTQTIFIAFGAMGHFCSQGNTDDAV